MTTASESFSQKLRDTISARQRAQLERFFPPPPPAVDDEADTDQSSDGDEDT